MRVYEYTNYGILADIPSYKQYYLSQIICEAVTLIATYFFDEVIILDGKAGVGRDPPLL
jgi:hypothetical protein